MSVDVYDVICDQTAKSIKEWSLIIIIVFVNVWSYNNIIYGRIITNWNTFIYTNFDTLNRSKMLQNSILFEYFFKNYKSMSVKN